MILVMLDQSQVTLWWIALAIGFVVVAVVVVLFTFLSRLLHDIRVGVMELDDVAERIETGTAAGDLRATASVLRDIRDEIRVHDDILLR